MESPIQSSFIPRDTVQKSPRVSYSSGAFDLVVLVSIVLLVATLALGVGVFLYLQFAQSNINTKAQQLERASAAFEPALVAELTRLDDRMVAAEEVLHSHIAPSELLKIMEGLTLETVSFSDMVFQAGDQQNMTMQLKGVARSVNSIALQADLFGKHSAIVSPIFENITRQNDGVHFDVSATINPAAIRYANIATGRVQQVLPTQLAGSEGDDTGNPQEEPGAPSLPPEEEPIPLFGPDTTTP